MPIERPQRPKQVTAACVACRNRKTKCDGLRPRCGPCVVRNINCLFTTAGNETQRQTERRRQITNEQYAQLYQLLISEDEQHATEIFRRIRSREAVKSILDLPRLQDDGPTTAARQHQHFFIFLLQSTLSLRQIVQVASRSLRGDQKLDLPPIDAYISLINMCITREVLCKFLHLPMEAISPPFEAEASKLAQHHAVDSVSPRGPYYELTAAPWLHGISDNAVSHFISLFIASVNPYWHFVEDDLFLAGFGGGEDRTPYCSTTLILSVLACSAMFSEVSEAFSRTGDFLSRGQQYHDEAVALLLADRYRPSLSNLQALNVLAVSAALRGRDDDGVNLAGRAAVMNRDLAAFDPLAADESEYTRARKCTSSTVVWLNLTFTFAHMNPLDSLKVVHSDAPDLAFLLDTEVARIGYPYGHRSRPLSVKELLLNRSKLSLLLWQIIDLYSRENIPSQATETLAKVRTLIEQIYQWKTSLPPSLTYNLPMTIGLFEMHAQYTCAVLMLYERVFGFLTRQETRLYDDDDELETFRAQTRKFKLQHCAQAAVCLRDYRQSFGSKIVMPFQFQQSTQAIFILLKDLQQYAEQAPTSEPLLTMHVEMQTGRVEGAIGTEDPRVLAFEEFFRALLSCGLQAMLPNSIVKAVCEGAAQLGLKLPQAAEEVLSMAGDMLRQPHETRDIMSRFSNWSLASESASRDEDSMERTITRMHLLSPSSAASQ